MQPVYQCDYCEKTGPKAEIEKHERDCVFNKAQRTCHTCGHRKGWTSFKCKKDKELPENSYMRHCDAWSEDVKEVNLNDPFSVYFDSFFGQTKEEKEKQNVKP